MEELTPNVFVETKYYPTVSFVVTSEGVVAIDSPMKTLQGAGIGNIYDQLDAHPAR